MIYFASQAKIYLTFRKKKLIYWYDRLLNCIENRHVWAQIVKICFDWSYGLNENLFSVLGEYLFDKFPRKAFWNSPHLRSNRQDLCAYMSKSALTGLVAWIKIYFVSQARLYLTFLKKKHIYWNDRPLDCIKVATFASKSSKLALTGLVAWMKFYFASRARIYLTHLKKKLIYWNGKPLNYIKIATFGAQNVKVGFK